MVCYEPIRACFSKSQFAKTGKKDLHLVLHENYDEKNKVIKDEKWQLNEKSFPHALYEYINIPCRKCVGCRSDNAKMWMIRAQNEMQMHKKNCFITLTYDNNSDIVEQDPLCIASLRYKHFQLFMKRLRKRFPDEEISFLVCGEYGLKDGRAHWHAILFGFDFPDKELVYVKKGYNHYFSQTLQDCWSTYDTSSNVHTPIGFVDLANCDNDCCSYVSQYVLKKLPVNQKGIGVGQYIDDEGNLKEIELIDVCPPLVRSSRRPSIGKRWFDKYGENAVEKGFIYTQNNAKTKTTKVRTPQYYYSKFEEINPVKAEFIKKCKEEKMKKYYEDHPVRLDNLHTWQEAHLYRIKSKIKGYLTKFMK